MTTPASRLLARTLLLLPRRTWTRLSGRLADARTPRVLPQALMRLFVRAYGIDLAEAAAPEGGYRSLNQLFTRALREGVRPIDPDPRSVVSPADGRLDDLGPIEPGQTFLVKGHPYDVRRLLGSAEEATLFAGGRYAIVYLAPHDYHRVHAPVAGRVARVRHVGGSLLPVNAFGSAHFPGLLARNERVVVLLRCPSGKHVAVVLVGAIGVGRIVLRVPAPARPRERDVSERSFPPGEEPELGKGAELGAFEFGSTVVVLLPPGSELGALPPGSTVRYGERIGAVPD